MFSTISKLALTAALLSGVPALAFAQSAAPTANAGQTPGATSTAATTSTDVNEVVVTGLKHKETLGELTQSATVVTQTQIQAQAFTDLTEVLRQEPGLQFQQAGAPGQFVYAQLRGFTDSTLYTIDGITLNGGGSGAINNFLGQIDPTMFDRVEILRGPHATLYGANTTSGIIALTTRTGNQYQSDISVEGGSIGWKKIKLDTENAVQLGAGTLHYSLEASQVAAGGMWKYEEYYDTSASGRVAYDLGNFELGASGYLSLNRFETAYLTESSPPYTQSTLFMTQTPYPGDWNHNHLEVGTVWLQQKITDQLTQKVTLGAVNQTDDGNNGGTANGLYIGSYTAPYNNFSDPNGTGTYNAGQAVPVYVYSYIFSDMERNREADYNLRYDNGPISGVVGATYLWQDYVESSTYGSGTSNQQDKSLYSDIGLDFFGDRLHAEIGGRLDDYSAWGDQYTYSLGANYKLVQGVNLYVNYGTSFTAPTLDQLYDPEYGSTSLTPATAHTWEGGVRLSQLDNKLTGSLTYWNSQVSNVIYYDYNIPNPRNPYGGYGEYANGNAEESSGVEAEGAYKFTPEWSLYANYTYTDARTEAGGVWAPQIESPKNMGNVGVTYSPAKFSVTANLFLTDSRYDYSGDAKAPGYYRLDLSGRYHLTDRLDLYLRAQDVTNKVIVEQLGYKNPRLYMVGGASYRF